MQDHELALLAEFFDEIYEDEVPPAPPGFIPAAQKYWAEVLSALEESLSRVSFDLIGDPPRRLDDPAGEITSRRALDRAILVCRVVVLKEVEMPIFPHDRDPQYEGLVVKTYSKTERIMSDVWETMFYAVVWDVEKGEPREIGLGCYDHLFGKEGPWDASVDATEDVERAYQAWVRAEKAWKVAAASAAIVQENIQRSQDRWDQVKKGKVMQVVRGRKVPKGTIGRVFWMDDPFHPTRVGLALTDTKDERGRFTDVEWVNADYLENADPYPGYKTHLEMERHQNFIEEVKFNKKLQQELKAQALQGDESARKSLVEAGISLTD